MKRFILIVICVLSLSFLSACSSGATNSPPGIKRGVEFSASMIDGFDISLAKAKKVRGSWVRIDGETGLGRPIDWINFEDVKYYSIE
jgi:hypothetical protein